MIPLLACHEMPVIHLHLPVIAEGILNIPKGFITAILENSLGVNSHLLPQNAGALESLNLTSYINLGRADAQRAF